MQVNMISAIEQIKNKSRDTFIALLNKLAREKKIMKQREKNEDDIDELLDNLKKARNEWMIASTNYEFAQEDELIDYYAYLIKASQIKYDYLLKKVKEKGTKLSLEEIYDLRLSKGQDMFNNLK